MYRLLVLFLPNLFFGIGVPDGPCPALGELVTVVVKSHGRMDSLSQLLESIHQYYPTLTVLVVAYYF